MAVKSATFTFTEKSLKQLDEVTEALNDNKSRCVRQAIATLHELLFNHTKNASGNSGTSQTGEKTQD